MFQVGNKGKKTIFPCVIESITNLETATMCFLCDSYNEDVRLDTELPHEVMKLHRKLAPYKVAIVFDQSWYILYLLSVCLLLNSYLYCNQRMYFRDSKEPRPRSSGRIFDTEFEENRNLHFVCHTRSY